MLLYTRIPALTKYYMSELTLEMTKIVTNMVPGKIDEACQSCRQLQAQLCRSSHHFDLALGARLLGLHPNGQAIHAIGLALGLISAQTRQPFA